MKNKRNYIIIILYVFIGITSSYAQIIYNDEGHIPQANQLNWANAGLMPSTIVGAQTVFNIDDYTGTGEERIFAALDDAKTATGLSIVFIPAGTYSISTPIELDHTDGNNIVFQGEGSESTILNFNVGKNNSCFHFSGILTGSLTYLNSDVNKDSHNLSACRLGSFFEPNKL